MAAGYVVYNVVSNTHDRTNVLLCSGSHKIHARTVLSDSTDAEAIARLSFAWHASLLRHAQKPRQTALPVMRLPAATTLASPSATRSTKEIATRFNQRGSSMASQATCQSAAPPLRLSGDSPDSRRGGTVGFNPSRRASCEGAREGRDSHCVRLKRGCMCAHFRPFAAEREIEIQDFALGVSTRC